MKKTYAYLSTAVVALLSLASCSRSDYAFKPAVLSYHVTAAPEQAASLTVATPATAATTAGSAFSETPVPVSRAQPQTAAVAQARSKKHDASAHLTKPIAKATKLQRAVAAKVIKQLRKNKEVTSTNEVQSRAGRAAIIGLIGLLLLFGGAAIDGTFGGIIATIGLIGFIVGVVILIIALINGE